ncbi:MAG TPA: 4-(cytidine 5'-diphospho)-2-C-methyl-D-erythritol kinase [Burkholderiales bacterium]|nr:4-(cytidine 5'-diphospho)-2-C-methyl-D-erythritol kinase [Burkholderiales bacterium]
MTALRWYPAPGKLNLLLHVLGRRDDGYHLLQTVFRLIDRCDRVGVRTRADGELRRVEPYPGVPEQDDLALRAALALKDYALARMGPAARPLGADIALEKNLPIGGGLGGGSSDAATVLLVLNRLWDLNLPRSELISLGLRLGADVPLFVFGESALGEGVGERLTALVLQPAWYLVLVPQVAVSTKEIFSDAALTRDTKQLKIPPFLSGQGSNDLEAVVTARYADVAAHLAWLRQHAAGARMTGSGACVFAEFSERDEAQVLQSQLPETMRGFVTRGLQRHPLYDWAD